MLVVERVGVVQVGVGRPAVVLAVPTVGAGVARRNEVGRLLAAPVHALYAVVGRLRVEVVYLIRVVGVEGQLLGDVGLHEGVHAQHVVRDDVAAGLLLHGDHAEVVLGAVGVLVDSRRNEVGTPCRSRCPPC